MKGDLMSRPLPERPDLAQLRRQAKDLHQAAASGNPEAVARIHAVSDRIRLSSAQLALAREYGFASWPRLRTEVERKWLITRGDVDGLARLVTAHPELARERVSSCYQDDTNTATALHFVAVARFHGLTNHDRAGEVARVLLAAGTPVDGPDGCVEPPLVTAASYGETDMARALIEAGADLEATGFAVPGGTALAHAVQFGNTDTVDLLVHAGAVVHNLVEAAGAGHLGNFIEEEAPAPEQARALVAAAVNERVGVIDQLLATGLAIDADTDASGASALHWAAYYGKPASVRHLLARGADPNRRDIEHHATPLAWCRHRQAELATFGAHLLHGHTEVERILRPLDSAAAGS